MKKRMLFPIALLAALSASCAIPALAPIGTETPSPDAEPVQIEGSAPVQQGTAAIPASVLTPTPLPTSTPVPTEAEEFVSNYGTHSYSLFSQAVSDAGLSPERTNEILGIYNDSAPAFNDARSSYGFPLDSVFSELAKAEDVSRLIEAYKAIGFKHGPQMAAGYVDQAFAIYGSNPLEEQMLFLNGGQWINGNAPPARAFLEIANSEMLSAGHSQEDVTILDLSGNPPSEQAYSSYISGILGDSANITAAPATEGLGPAGALSAIQDAAAGNGFLDMTLNLHGYTESFVLSGDGNPGMTQTSFWELSKAIVDGYSQGNGSLDRLVLRLNECGGSTSVQNLATALYSTFQRAGIQADALPQIYIQVSNDAPSGLTDLGAYSFGQIENWQGAPGITDFNWADINARGAANIYSGENVLLSVPTDFAEKSIDLNVQTYQLTPEGAIQRIPTESQVLLSPIYVGSYANP